MPVELADFLLLWASRLNPNDAGALLNETIGDAHGLAFILGATAHDLLALRVVELDTHEQARQRLQPRIAVEHANGDDLLIEGQCHECEAWLCGAVREEEVEFVCYVRDFFHCDRC